MDNREILQKAIEKAIKNGCGYSAYKIDINLYMEKKLYYNVIFAHDFAKAFWGDKFIIEIGIGIGNPAWRHHLQQMVLCEEPIKYLEKFL